jgi:hypothetical protein
MAFTLRESMRAHHRAHVEASRRNAMKVTLVVNDLSLPEVSNVSDTSIASHVRDLRRIALTRDRMKRIVGGRTVVVGVDGHGVGTVDDWDINTAIFEGRIKGSYL